MKELAIKDMDSNLTIWENLKSSFSIPEQQPFKVIGELDVTVFNDILQMYRDTLCHTFMDDWKGSKKYRGRCFHYNDYAPKAFDAQYSNEYESVDKRYTYESTLCFYKPTKLGSTFQDLFYPFQPVRSKIARLEAGEYEGDWHSDEDVREVVKLVIPVKTSNSYMIQLEGSEPFNLSLGQALLFDASVPHRILSDGYDNAHRDYLIFSIPVWWMVNGGVVSISDYYGKSIPHTFLKETNLFKND